MSDKRIAFVVVEHCTNCPFFVYHDDETDGHTKFITCSKIGEDFIVPISGISVECPLEFV